MAVFIFGFGVCRGLRRVGNLFFRLIEFLNVLLCCWFQTSCLVRVYETEESFHGRQGTLSADGLFFSFRFWSMARPFLVFRRRRSISVQESFRFGTRIPYRSGARTGEGNGGFRRDRSHLGMARDLHDCDGCEVAQQNPTAELSVPLFQRLPARFWPEKFVAILGRLFWSEPVTACVFGHYARNQEMQKIIFTSGFRTAAAHFESSKRMAADHRARARAVDVKVAGFQTGFHPLNVIGAAREKATG